MSLIRIVSILLSISIFSIGISIFIRNKKQLVNQFFIAFALLCSIWAISYTNIELIDNISAVKIVNSITYAVSILMVYCGVAFTYVFPVRRRTNFFKFAALPITSMVILCFTPLVSGYVTRDSGESVVYHYANGELSSLYLVTMAIALILIAKNLFIKNISYSKQESNQASLIAIGFLLSAVIGVSIANIIPSLVGIQELDNFAPFSLIFLVAFTAYAIVKHRLFDIRLVVARSLGYLLTLVVLTGTYILSITVITTQFFDNESISAARQFANVIVAIGFGFSLPPLKKFFDKWTNKLFFRDAYDAQELLDKLNKVLVGNIELDYLLKQTADLIASTIKAEYVAFIIRETSGTARRASFSKIVELDTNAILGMDVKKKESTQLIIADEIERSNNALKSVMTVNNISIAARLVAKGSKAADQGYLLLGPKLSGNPYNKQDLQVLDIIANELVIAIQNALRFEEIETFNITLQEKVNDATRKLRQTNEKLKEIDETKDEFISMASHQLRTPLTSVKGYVSMVVEGDAGKLNKQQRELLGQAFASSQRMVYLIADLLNVSRLKTGKFVIENKPTQLADVIESEMQQLTETAKTKDQILTYNKPAKFPVLNMDETKIRQVIMNFTDNALHYTPNGGHIQVNLADKGDQIEFTVVDDGLGVPKAEQHHLFTKFYRANNAKKARPDGTGLGLFMAKKVIIAQGGAVIFQSTENKGSTFGFTFPKSSLKATDSSIKSSVKSLDEAITK